VPVKVPSTRAVHHTQNLQTKTGTVKLKVSKLRPLTCEIAIIERYRLRESSVKEALIEMYLSGIKEKVRKTLGTTSE
jgi:transposase-like protein